MRFFSKNIGKPARIARAAMGVALIAVAVYSESMIAAAIGIFSIGQGLFSWCVMYALFNKSSSCAIKEKNSKPL